jgi:hypothetical protein
MVIRDRKDGRLGLGRSRREALSQPAHGVVVNHVSIPDASEC